MLFNERELRNIAKRVGLGAPQVQKLLGSIKVPLMALSEEEHDQVLEVGLNIYRIQPRSHGSPRLQELAERTIRDYQNRSPGVLGWILSGGFRPDEVPGHIGRSSVVHACRTAGRLRAFFLRESRGLIGLE